MSMSESLPVTNRATSALTLALASGTWVNASWKVDVSSCHKEWYLPLPVFSLWPTFFHESLRKPRKDVFRIPSAQPSFRIRETLHLSGECETYPGWPAGTMALPLEFSASVSDLCSASCLHINKMPSFSDPVYKDLQEWITFDARYHKGCCLFCTLPFSWYLEHWLQGDR